mgnify:CR=1 FL=1
MKRCRSHKHPDKVTIDILQQIIARLDEGFDADIGERLTVSVSIGISLIKDDYNTRVEYLIGKADDALYRLSDKLEHLIAGSVAVIVVVVLEIVHVYKQHRHLRLKGKEL